MGYEVLGADDGPTRLPSTPLSPDEIVPMDDLAAPHEEAPRRPTTSRRFPVVPSRTTAAAVLALGALIAGLAAGGAWSQHRAALHQAAERAGRLSIVAVITNVDSAGDARALDYTVKLVNAGPLPVDLVVTPEGTALDLDTPIVRDLGGARRVPADGTLSASVRLAVDCSGHRELPDEVRVPVRTTDGTRHDVVASLDNMMAASMFWRSPCASTDGPALQATLAGSIKHPLLRLHNGGPQPLQVTLDRDSSPFIAQTRNFSVLRLTPTLPQVLAPGETTSLTVDLTPWSCPHGLSVVLNSQVSPYVVLRAGPPGGQGVTEEPVGVDLSMLWGAALARDCG